MPNSQKPPKAEERKMDWELTSVSHGSHDDSHDSHDSHDSLARWLAVCQDPLTGLVFVDFHKAFDILNHNLLLMKSSVYGASPDSMAWFQSYLAG